MKAPSKEGGVIASLVPCQCEKAFYLQVRDFKDHAIAPSSLEDRRHHIRQDIGQIQFK
jgi:hypothetical protein